MENKKNHLHKLSDTLLTLDSGVILFGMLS